jgi:membrane protein YdbS with pleckstrin-like domain
VALAWRAHRWPGIEYRHAAYRVDDRGIEIRRGVVWRRLISVPRSRVQHTDVSQGPLERTHGLGTLVIYTAGTDHARVDLPGLDHAAALRIRAHLLPQGDGDAV